VNAALFQDGTSLLEAARSLRPTIEAQGEQIERHSALPTALVDDLARTGFFTMLVPRDLGGAEVEPETCLRIIEEIARADGSVGWCLHVGTSLSLAAGWLPLEVAREIWSGDSRVSVSGSATSFGTATVVDGGYRISGRWGFASGCTHASWIIATVNVVEDGIHRIGPNGEPESLFAFFPRRDCQILETWDVTGMRGTGSHEFVVEDVFVPNRLMLPRSYAIAPRSSGPIYAFGGGAVPGADGTVAASSPWLGQAAPGMAAVTLGIARGALDAFADLAATKVRARYTTVLRDDPIIQTLVGRSEAKIRAARAFLFETVADVWESVVTTGVGTSDGQAMVRLASVHAAETAVEVVEALWRAAGTSAIVVGSPFDRRLRDVMVASQNVSISPLHIAGTGRMLLSRAAGG
jgi:alkylation response protein AidB-like acyl-CoA dehydrogenase